MSTVTPPPPPPLFLSLTDTLAHAHTRKLFLSLLTSKFMSICIIEYVFYCTSTRLFMRVILILYLPFTLLSSSVQISSLYVSPIHHQYLQASFIVLPFMTLLFQPKVPSYHHQMLLAIGTWIYTLVTAPDVATLIAADPSSEILRPIMP